MGNIYGEERISSGYDTESEEEGQHILTEIIRINQMQSDELENPASDPDDFDWTVQGENKAN